MLLVKYFDNPSTSPNYIDLRVYADDKRVLKNPNKGWFVHFVDNSLACPLYRSGIEKGDYLEDFPGLNHMYIRFDWGDIEKEEGKYDWSQIDEIIEEWALHGYTFAFRLCTFETAYEAPYATPKFVFDAGAGYIDTPNNREPDYGDPIYLEKLENFTREFGRKFNGSPLVEYVEVGSFGTWGEGHTYCGSEKIFPKETLKKHLDITAKYFPDTIILANDDMLWHCYQNDTLKNGMDRGVVEWFTEYAAGLGMGIRDDSILVNSYVRQMGYDSTYSPSFCDRVWRFAPTNMERGHFGSPDAGGDDANELVFMEALRNMHSTFAGFHGIPRVWLNKNREITEYMANRMGYWYFLDGIDFPVLVSGLTHYAVMRVRNRGFAPAYHDYDVKMELRSEDGRKYEIVREGWKCNNRFWMPDEVSEERVALDLRGVPAGTYKLFVGMFDKHGRPVHFAMTEDIMDSDAMYGLVSVTVE